MFAISSSDVQSAGRDQCRRGAAALAAEILAHGVFARDGSITWLGPKNPQPGEPIKLTPVGPHLYGGATGIALFLAAAERELGNGEYRPVSLQAIAPLRAKLRELLDDPSRAVRLALGVGGLWGLGSFAYSFLRIGQWLGEPALIQEAYDLTTLLTEERIANDQRLEVVAGSAGTILALLALERAAGQPPEAARLLDLASACAHHLIRKRAPAGGWTTLPGFPPLSGFAHGAAGISYALLRLHQRTLDSAVWNAAMEGLAFERSLYVPDQRNWRDMRFPDIRFMASWCHGAPGIALGRAAALDALDTPEVREELRNALITTCSTELYPLDHVCCGNMGKVEILHFLALRLGQESLLQAAYTLATAVRERAERNGHYLWVLEAPRPYFDPSFFTGAAGAGYSLLRLASPDSLPCVLLMD